MQGQVLRFFKKLRCRKNIFNKIESHIFFDMWIFYMGNFDP